MAPLKIVALIGTPVHLNYFVNRIAEEHELALVIRENTRTHLLKKIRDKGWIRSLKIIIKHFLKLKKVNKDYDTVLDQRWKQVNPSIPYMETAGINHPDVIEQLNRIQPDIVIVQGTSLIRNKTIARVPLVLNLHWGLSPYYKGSMCTEWAILNRDMHNIGFTIHQVAKNIDGGAIYTQGRPGIEISDNANRINMKLTRDGAKAMAAALSVIRSGHPLPFINQNKNMGNLYLVKDWTKKEAKELRLAERNIAGVMAASRKLRYPIVVDGQLREL